MSASIFISYASHDQKVAETICHALEARGYACWIACRDVGAGQNFQESIVRAIRSAKVMLLVFTSEANNSNEIKKELVLASRHNVTVVPVRVEDIAPNDALAYELATRQWIDLFKDWERDIERLGSQVGSILADGGVVVVAKSAQPARKRSSLRLLALLSPLIIVPSIGGAYLYWSAVPAPLAARDDRAARLDEAKVEKVETVSQPVTAPPAPQLAEAERLRTADDKAWANASAVGTIEAFNRYLVEFSDGAQAAQARRAIAALEQQLAKQIPVSGKTRFDGTWQTTIVCSSAGGAQGYTLRFDAQAKDGFFRGVRGNEGKPGWLALEGKIQLDGRAELLAQGLTNNTSFVVGGAPTGTNYKYHILARFEGASGTGTRVDDLRPCSFNAVKR